MEPADDLVERVRALLNDVPHVEERKMFGSIGFTVDGKLLCGVGDHADHQMMVGVGTDAYEDALKQDGTAPATMRGQARRGWVFLDHSAVNTDDKLRYWINLALTHNKEL